jgi:hypothetical protein
MEFAFSEARPRITRFECREAERSGNQLILRYAALAGDTETYAFAERIELPGPLPDTPATDGLVRLLTLAASLSYYKAFAPVPFAVPGGLTAIERRFIAELIAGPPRARRCRRGREHRRPDVRSSRSAEARTRSSRSRR